jgi:hypothetical protein
LIERRLPREDCPRPLVDVGPQFTTELDVVADVLVQIATDHPFAIFASAKPVVHIVGEATHSQ